LEKKNTREDLRAALENLPEGLDETYTKAIERIDSQDEDEVQLAKKVLSWISYALRPLTVKEIQHAIAVRLGETAIYEGALPDGELLTSLCAGLVTIDQESDVIRLVHYTTQEYFERNCLNMFPNGQTNIAMTCLTYLSFDVFEIGYCSSDEQMEARLKENPFLQYAAQYWGIHAKGGTEPIISRQILEFITQGSRLSSSVQAMQLPSHRHKGYSQYPPKSVPGLWIAAVFGLIGVIRLLIEQGNDINAKTTSGETALHGAAKSGHEAVVLLLLEKGADIEARAQYGRTALHSAAESGHETVVRLLLKKGIDIKVKDRYGGTALHDAAECGHASVVRLLLEKKADIGVRTQYGGTVLRRAAGGGHETLVRLLLEKGADIDVRAQGGGTTLDWAAGGGREVPVRLLFETEADIDKSQGRETALFREVWIGHEVRDEGKWPALHGAAIHGAAGSGHEAVVQLLLEKGAEVDAKTGCGATPLHWAAWNGHRAVMRLLLKEGAAIHARSHSGATALHWAAWRGHEAAVRLLLDKGADVNAKDETGFTVLHGAAGSGHGVVVQLLLEKEAEINAKDQCGRTALYVAAAGGHEAVVRLLLDQRADIKAQGGLYGTALEAAAYEGHEMVVRLLFENGASIDDHGRNALHLATKAGHKGIIE
jgi:ankyrin repeat protein